MIFILACSNNLHGQEIISLSGNPGGDGPSITMYVPVKQTSIKTSNLVIPVGAYSFLAFEDKGTRIAQAFAARGITAFALRYRLPSEVKTNNRSTVPLEDAQSALQMIKDRAREWNLDSAKIGVIGFSAGGHLAACLGTIAKVHPQFMALAYPIISMKAELTHMGSRINLLGAHPSGELVNKFSLEEQVSACAPPIYITHAADDSLVSVQNSIVFYQALLKQHIPAELHLFAKGDHGFIQRLPINEFIDPILLWMKKLQTSK